MSKMPFDYDFKPGEIAWAWYTNLSTGKGVELYFFEIEKFHGDYVSGWLLMSYDKPGRRICHDFEFPEKVIELLEGNRATLPEVAYMDELDNPFLIILCMTNHESNEGKSFWKALLAKYKEEEHDPSQVTDVDVLILLSRYSD